MFKYLIIVFAMLFSIASFAQPGKRLKIKSGLEKCVDALGDPIEDCMIMSLANGEFKPTEIADVVAKLNIENAGAIDSIYANNDTLYVVYFNAPTLSYYAPGLNGLFSSGNNNKKIGGTLNTFTTLLPTTLWTLTNNQTNPNQFTIQFSTSSRQLLLTTGAAQLEPLRVTSYIGTTSSSRVWRTGSAAGNYNIVDATTGGTPIRMQIQPGSGLPSIPSLLLQSDGDLQLGQYDVTRPFAISPTNFAGFDANGVLQKYEVDSVFANVLENLPDAKYFQSVIYLDSADIVNLHTTPIIAIPAQPGKLIAVHRTTTIFKAGTLQYTGGGGANIGLREDVSNVMFMASAVANSAVIGASDRYRNSVQSGLTTYDPELNSAVEIATGATPFTGGNGTIKFLITYEIVDPN